MRLHEGLVVVEGVDHSVVELHGLCFTQFIFPDASLAGSVELFGHVPLCSSSEVFLAAELPESIGLSLSN